MPHRIAMTAFADHFSKLAAHYAQFRPHYPPELVDALADRCPAHRVAWDIGCGSGQLSIALTARFDHVIATDPAQAQLDHAEPHARVEYRCETAEASSLADASADLAVAAQSAHWLDWPRFVPEVGRVVRPGGLIALVTYFNAELPGDVGAVLRQFYIDIGPHWPDGRSHVRNRYRDLTFPWPSVDAPPVHLVAQWTRDELFGYVTTWSATGRLVAAGGEARLEQLSHDLAAVWPEPDGERREVRWPLTIKLTRR
jgi:SAM-dependent methyltransferase